ncbi:hypothetical protein HAX54_041648, partial [Datura stramonium]|nr:hypothetical protein [Datura stramonium]
MNTSLRTNGIENALSLPVTNSDINAGNTEAKSNLTEPVTDMAEPVNDNNQMDITQSQR